MENSSPLRWLGLLALALGSNMPTLAADPAPDGSIYATESLGGTVYRLAPGARDLAKLFPNDALESPNGIVALDRASLVVADFDGIALVSDPAGAAPKITRLGTPGDVYLGGIDGLARAGPRVIAIQNLVGRGRVWRLTVDVARNRVTDARILMRGHDDFLNPTTGAIVGDRFLFVADPKVQVARPDGTVSPLPAGRTGHRVVELSLPPLR